MSDAWLYVPALTAGRRAGQGLAGRRPVDLAQPAVRRRVHLSPEGSAQDPESAAPGNREGGGQEEPGRARASWDELRAEDRGGGAGRCS